MNIILRIKKKLKSIFYYLMSDNRGYDVYPMLDILLIYLEEIGVKEYIKKDEYYSIIVFNDDTTFYFWDVNRWFAWMNTGKITFSNGKELSWEKKMPSNEVMYKFKKIVKKYEKNKIEQDKQDNDYSEYLPIKTVRKLKLKKLK